MYACLGRGGIPLSKISRAIISVSDKTGIVEFAKELASMGVEITGDIEVNYVDYPWLTRFEVEGIRPL